MVLHSADAAGVRDPDDHGQLDGAPGAVAHLGDVADDLLERRVGEGVELHLDHRAHAVHGHARRPCRRCRTRPAGCRSSGPRRRSAVRPSVMRKTPPSMPTSSPKTRTDAASRRPWRRAGRRLSGLAPSAALTLPASRLTCRCSDGDGGLIALLRGASSSASRADCSLSCGVRRRRRRSRRDPAGPRRDVLAEAVAQLRGNRFGLRGDPGAAARRQQAAVRQVGLASGSAGPRSTHAATSLSWR